MENVNQNSVVTTVDIEVQRSIKGELIDAIAAHSKLTKADAGRILDTNVDLMVKFKATKPAGGTANEFPNVEIDIEEKTSAVIVPIATTSAQ